MFHFVHKKKKTRIDASLLFLFLLLEHPYVL